ncbi:MAG: hypothetical protein EBX41_07475 [Chitinophagia bacterium]|nr:hypothetical protein [Chitinophagia bacterium]
MILAPLFVFMWIIIRIAIIVAIPILAGMWKIYEKAGQPGWACIVPIYNSLILFGIIGKPWWWVLLMCIPFVGIIWHIWAINMLSKSFGKDEAFTVGLYILGFIFFPILGFGSAVYQGPYGDPAAFRAYQESKNAGYDFEQNKFSI